MEKGDLRGFDRFWAKHPKKVGKLAAQKVWRRLKPTEATVDEMIATLDWQIQSPQWRRDGGQYIPYPATWLNQGRWMDERPANVAVPAAPSSPYSPEAEEERRRVALDVVKAQGPPPRRVIR